MARVRCWPVVLLMVACGPALAGDDITLPSKTGAVQFPHARHFGVAGGCVACHHTSKPGEAMPTCHACHHAGNGVRSAFRAFHDSCLGCHERTARAGQKSGPVKRCAACHQQAR